MIDWHSHVIPAVDDGSRDIEESLKMLSELKAQGVDCVVATPHFIANAESVEEFISRRDEAYASLTDSMSEDLPKVLCGAEVKYYPGIAKMEGLEKLTVSGTNILLLEMPMTKWTKYTLRELFELASAKGLTIVMAHIERYLAMQEKNILDTLCENGILIQVNASFLNGFWTKGRALKLMAGGYIHFIGSDCHNMTTRAPKIGVAYDFIKKKCGEDYFHQMDSYGYRKLNLR